MELSFLMELNNILRKTQNLITINVWTCNR